MTTVLGTLEGLLRIWARTRTRVVSNGCVCGSLIVKLAFGTCSGTARNARRTRKSACANKFLPTKPRLDSPVHTLSTLESVGAEKTQQIPPNTAGRLSNMHPSSACDITLKDDDETVPCVGSCDDGADDSLVSPHLEESIVLNGVGKIEEDRPRNRSGRIEGQFRSPDVQFLAIVDGASPTSAPVGMSVDSSECFIPRCRYGTDQA